MRLFFALPVPAEARERLRSVVEGARQLGGEGVSFTKVDQLHFTLAFLGEQPRADDALSAGAVLRECSVFAVGLAGAGALAHNSRPCVRWLGGNARAQVVVDDGG